MMIVCFEKSCAIWRSSAVSLAMLVAILLRRDGLRINCKKTQLVYGEESLTAWRRKGRKLAIGARAPALVPAQRIWRWSLDFVHDRMPMGLRFRVLNIVDDVTRECVAAVPDASISGTHVVSELSELIAMRGTPGMIVRDNGTDPTSNMVLGWCGDPGSSGTTSLRASSPRMPLSRALNRRMRDELLSETPFTNLGQARRNIAGWAHRQALGAALLARSAIPAAFSADLKR